MADQVSKKLKQIMLGAAHGISGIITEIGYALTIMLVAFFICVLVTSF